MNKRTKADIPQTDLQEQLEDRRTVAIPAPALEEHIEQGPDDKEARGSGRLRRPLVIAATLVGLVLIVAAGVLYWDYAAHFESTDDAFIASRQFSISPRVSGYITAVLVTDNQHVKVGDVIARIDDRDYRVALRQADAQVALADANLQNVDAQTAVAQAQLKASQAQEEQVQAALSFASQQAERYRALAQKQVGTVETAEQWASQQRQQQAALASAQANVGVVQRQLEALGAQRKSAEANVAQAKAQRDLAELNLSYTNVTAAQSGNVVNLSAATGQYAQAGTSLTMFVPDEVWVTANFKETQLDRMRKGDPAKMAIDAYPDHTIDGHVASIQRGSGTAFSLLPAENATGNYVKITQRVPVKLVMDNPPAGVAIGPGMSVTPTVRVDPNPSYYERLKRWL